jgi:hypothetical protein
VCGHVEMDADGAVARWFTSGAEEGWRKNDYDACREVAEVPRPSC